MSSSSPSRPRSTAPVSSATLLTVRGQVGERREQQRERARDVRCRQRRPLGGEVEAVQVGRPDADRGRGELRGGRTRAARRVRGWTTRTGRRRCRCRPPRRPRGCSRGCGSSPRVGPSLPAAKTGRIPAARRLRRSAWNSSEQPATDIVHESLTTFGASAVAGFPSGSSSHWKPRWMVVDVAAPRSSKIFTAIHGRRGRHPDRAAAGGAADHDPHRRGPVAVDVGRHGRVLAVRVEPAVRAAAPGARELRLGRRRRRCPCSRRRCPWPRNPCAHIAGAPTRSMFGSVAAATAAGDGRDGCGVQHDASTGPGRRPAARRARG